MTTVVRFRLAVARALILLVGWLLSWAAVAQVLEAPELTELPWLQSGIGVLVATLGGLTSTLIRYTAAVYDGKKFNAKVEVAQDFAVSIVIGLGGYWVGIWHQMRSEQIALSLLLGGVGGKSILTIALSRFSAMVGKE